MAFLIGGRASHLPPNPFLIKSEGLRARASVFYMRVHARETRARTRIFHTHARARNSIICIVIKKK